MAKNIRQLSMTEGPDRTDMVPILSLLPRLARVDQSLIETKTGNSSVN